VAAIAEKANELGRILGQTDEYQALKRAHEQVNDSPELKDKMERLDALARNMETGANRGQEPSEQQVEEYEKLLGEIQGSPVYQAVVAAQSNFDKLMLKVNKDIMEGIRKGAESRIITLG